MCNCVNMPTNAHRNQFNIHADHARIPCCGHRSFASQDFFWVIVPYIRSVGWHKASECRSCKQREMQVHKRPFEDAFVGCSSHVC
jgi:hypothetical protein